MDIKNNMLRIVLALLFSLGLSINVTGQTKDRQIAIFVYCDKSVSTPVSALSSRLSSSLIDGNNSSYIVVDRSEEIIETLRKEYQYQGTGLVRDDQLSAVGEQMGVDMICAINITYYSDYNQYFFDCKLVNIETTQIEKHVFFPNNATGQHAITDLSPQTQLSVAQELASAIGLLSSAQLIEREYSIGDIYYDNNNKPVGAGDYRIGFIDGTKKHGIAFRVHSKSKWPHRVDANLGATVPTIRQLQLLQNNKTILGLYGEYWSCDKGPKNSNGEYTFRALDFYTGRVNNRVSASSEVFQSYSRKNEDGSFTVVVSPRYKVYYDGYDELENISVIVF